MGKYIFALLIILIPFIGNSQPLFTQPSATFIVNPANNITDLSFHQTSVDSVQSVINTTRSAFPNNIIRITLAGSFYINATPLTLSSQSLLILNNATLWADNKTTATSLIAIPSDTLVSIFAAGNAVLDGSNYNLTGINVTSSGKTSIDGLTIQNCNNGGIYYSGRGANIYADAGAVTRCIINNCGTTGITYNNSFNFICTDNTITHCTLGIQINGNNSAVSNNIIKYCTTGLQSVSSNEAITYNTLDSCTTGVSLSTASNATLVAYNSITGNTIGISAKGTKANIYYNRCNNTQQVTGGGTYNELFCNDGITPIQGNVAGCTYFNPPTTANPHSDIIKIGEKRFDISINTTPLSAIRGILDSVHRIYPNTVIVAHLNGTFTAPTPNDSLIVYDDECILLNGTISGNDSCGKLVSFADGCTSSFSGGTINGNNIDGKTSLVYITGSSNVVLDSVYVINSYGQGITKRNSSVSTYIRACNLNNIRSRCIWNITSPRLFAFQNTASNGGKDGIDLDAGSTNCVVEKNVCTNNLRNGVFIEEGAKGHIVLGNTLSGSINGLEFYNLMVSNSNSARCLVAYNNCFSNAKGILVSALNSSQASTHNVLFNNNCNNNTSYGFTGFYSNGVATNNYVAMNTCLHNTTSNYYPGIDYTNNSFWNMITNPKLLPIHFNSFEGLKVGAEVKLNWVLSATVDITRFEIEKSSNGSYFTSVGSVCKGFTLPYSFQDKSPYDGNNFYRIKAIGLDGTFNYSNSIKVAINSTKNLLVTCFQPAKGILTVSISTTEAFKKVIVDLVDLSGKRISIKEYTNLNTTQLKQSIQVPSYCKGVYILSVKTDKAVLSKEIEVN